MKIKNQHGRSMIEMLGVLGIMAVITVLGISAYSMATKNIKVNNAKNEIYSIIQLAQSRSPNNDFRDWCHVEADSCNGADKSFQGSLYRGGLFNKLENAFGGYSTIHSSGYAIWGNYAADEGEGLSKNNQLAIALYDLSEDECRLLQAQNWSNAYEGSVNYNVCNYWSSEDWWRYSITFEF